MKTTRIVIWVDVENRKPRWEWQVGEQMMKDALTVAVRDTLYRLTDGNPVSVVNIVETTIPES
jgi:hypothetical protein